MIFCYIKRVYLKPCRRGRSLTFLRDLAHNKGSQIIQAIIVLAVFAAIMTGAIFALRSAIHNVGDYTVVAMEEDVMEENLDNQ